MTDEKAIPEGVNVGDDDDDDDDHRHKPEATINTNNAKDDCSDLTDNNHETDEQAPKSFPQKVRISFFMMERNFVKRVR